MVFINKKVQLIEDIKERLLDTTGIKSERVAEQIARNWVRR